MVLRQKSWKKIELDEIGTMSTYNIGKKKTEREKFKDFEKRIFGNI